MKVFGRFDAVVFTCVLGACMLGFVDGQLNFGQENGFQLTVSQNFFRPGDDVTLTCRKSEQQNIDNSPRSLVFTNTKGITWERNGQSMFSTLKEGEACRVQPQMILGRPAVTLRELEAVTCAENDTSVRVTIRNVTISSSGDRWICSRFPFLESNAVSLYNFVPLNSVSLTAEDHFPNDANTRVLMTLICQASPCNPPPSVTWQLLRDNKPLALPEQSRTRSQVDSYGHVTLASELAVTADPRYENTTVMCRASNSVGAWIQSNMVTLTVRRPPRILLTANPSSEVIEGTDVTLTCGAHGHPRPTVQWRKEGGYLPGGLLEADTPIVRLSPVRTPDRGEYICTAFNGVAPDAVSSIYLKVDEPVRTLKISDEDRSMEVSDEKSTGHKNKQSRSGESGKVSNDDHNNENENDEDNSGSAGTVAAIVISILVVVAAVGVGALWLMNKRRKQNFLSSPGALDSLFPRYPNRSMTTLRPGLYAPRSSLRPTTHTPLTMDSVPQYLELPPAPSPPVGVTNGGYGLSQKSRGTKTSNGRPLPAAPAFDESRYTWDTGYQEIHDVTSDTRRPTSADGYEIPVLHEEEEEEEEECIYDVARPIPPDETRASLRGGSMYMNENSFSTHM